MSTFSYKTVPLLLAGAFMLFGAGCTRTDVATPAQSGRLPDHITVVHGATLPQALFQARQDGKSLVRITDKQGRMIEATVASPITTAVSYSLLPEQDLFATLQERGVDTSKFYDKQATDLVGSFSMNVVNHAEVATILYELSVGYHQIRSTTEWTIDLIP